MRRYTLALIATLALICCALVVAPAAAARPAATGEGTINGRVVNGTHGNAPVADLTVTLQDTVNTRASDAASVKTDAQGRFSFSGLDLSGMHLYSVYAHFQDGVYSTNPVQFDNSPRQQVQLTVYDAATNDANLSIKVATVLLREPRQRNGLIGIGEFVTFHNSGTTAFVGKSAPVNGDPRTLLRFALPQGATNITLGVGFASADATAVDGGFAATATVPPGDTQFAFAYDVPYQGTQYTLPYRTVYPTDQVIALIPPDMFVDNGSFTAQGLVDTFGSRYQVFYVNKVRPASRPTLHLWNLPEAGEPSYLDFRALVVLGLALALVIGLLLALYLRRGDLAPVFGLVPVPGGQAPSKTPPGGAGTTALSGEEREAERKRLLQELLDFERAHHAGKLSEREYRRREAEARSGLRALLADESAASEVSAAAATDATQESPASDATVTPAPAEPPALKGGSR
jgi:hypothetical protein